MKVGYLVLAKITGLPAETRYCPKKGTCRVENGGVLQNRVLAAAFCKISFLKSEDGSREVILEKSHASGEDGG